MATPLIVSEMTRKQLNDWYEQECGYSPDDDGKLPIGELRELVAEFAAECIVNA